MTFRSVISVLLALTLALASPLGLAAPWVSIEKAAGCEVATSCPCCEGPVCPCVGEAPQPEPQPPIAPRPTSDLRLDIAPVPFRVIVLVALPIAESFAKPVARLIATHDGVRPQASFCIWRT